MLKPVLRPHVRRATAGRALALAAAGIALAALALRPAARAQEPATPTTSPGAPVLAPLTETLPSFAYTDGLLTAIPLRLGAAWPLGVMAPDSEVAYGITLFGFDTEAFAAEQGGFLTRHLELVDGQATLGPAIVERVAREYSVGPRVLLALLELSSGWVTNPAPAVTSAPMGGSATDLYGGLIEAADALNEAFYGWRAGGRAIQLGDGTWVEIPEGNAGTMAMHHWLARHATLVDWSALQEPSRFWTTWVNLYGEDPVNFAGPINRPAPLPPAALALPFAAGPVWYFVQGPAPAAGMRAARAAVAFAPPPADLPGCVPSVEPVRAMDDGIIARSDDVAVVLDLDGDGDEISGWTVVYRHLSTVQRAPTGERVDTGDVLGYASCDGGVEQTQVSVARRFNGEWIAADDPEAPMVLGGWLAVPGEAAGEGTLVAPGLTPRRAQAARVDAENGLTALANP